MSRLYQPIQLGPKVAPTRIVSLPHGQLSLPPAQLRRYYGALARADVGMIVLGGSVVSPESGGARLNPLFDPGFVESLAVTVDAIHEQESLFVVQILHIGAQMAGISPPFQPVFAPSSIRTTGNLPEALTARDIARIRRDFAQAADRVADVQADGFELHAAHNYLLHQFLSPGQNTRTDAYGGDVRGRSRLLTEIATDIRTRHPDRVLGVRLGFGTVGKFGLSEAEAMEVAEDLDQAGLVDYVTVSVPSYPHLYVRDESFQPGGMRAVSRILKAHVSCAVTVTQRIDTTELANDIVTSGDADLVGVARELLADPEWASRRRPGQLTRPCVRCMQGCRPDFHRAVACDVNPTALSTAPAAAGPGSQLVQRVVVLGGGPAGCEAAVALAQRGVEVALFDDHEVLGGRARLAGAAPHRKTWREYADYLDAWVRHDARIELRLGQPAAADQVAEWAPDVIVGAVGARVCAGACPVPVLTSDELLRAPEAGAAKRVLVVDEGGRWDALNVVEALSDLASDIVYATSRERVGDAVAAQSRPFVRRRLRQMSNVSLIVSANVSWDSASRAVIHGLGDRPQTEPADVDLVVWSGMLQVNEIDEQTLDLGVPVWRIGDSLSPRGLGTATKEGYQVASRVKTAVS